MLKLYRLTDGTYVLITQSFLSHGDEEAIMVEMFDLGLSDMTVRGVFDAVDFKATLHPKEAVAVCID